MKPAQISALILAGALGGAVMMKVVQRPHPATGNFETKPIAAAPVSTPAPAVPPQAAPATLPASQPPVQAQDTAAATAPPVAPPATAKAESKAQVDTKGPLPVGTKPISKAPASAARRHAPPPANPRPLVVAKLDHPPQPLPVQQTPPPAPVESAPAPLVVPPASTPAVQESPIPQAPPATPPENVTPPAPPPPVPHTVTLNAGLLIPVRLVDGLSSERNAPGDTFLATIDREVVVDGFVIAERGARVEGRVVASGNSSRLKGNAMLSVELTRLHTSDRQVVPIDTEAFEKHVQAERGEDIAKVGAGAAIGAVIGAIAGGGKGAAIGAGVGGGAGAGSVMLTRKPATLPSETRITFRLRSPVKLTEKLD
jgi:hypothetical protein